MAQDVASLSGGNQQKVVIGKWLLSSPRVLICDEPTRGVDIGAKIEIYRHLRELAGQGLGIIMVSSELPETLGMCDRLLVMRKENFRGALGRGGDGRKGHGRGHRGRRCGGRARPGAARFPQRPD